MEGVLGRGAQSQWREKGKGNERGGDVRMLVELGGVARSGGARLGRWGGMAFRRFAIVNW